MNSQINYILGSKFYSKYTETTVNYLKDINISFNDVKEKDN